MSEAELILDENIPVRSPDLVAMQQGGGEWVVQQASARFAQWLGLDVAECRGRQLGHDVGSASPGLDYLASEVLGNDQDLIDVPVHFLEPVDRLLRADVVSAGLSSDYQHRLVHFHFRLPASGQARQHTPVSRFGLVGGSPGMLEVYRKVDLYAETDAAVVVTGETGTGKELVARALHEQSARRKFPFVAVNCSAISPELLESELFGHEKGAFTGAVRPHRGRFERAHQGTIFLDEIGDMPMHAQTRLLRVLEEGRLERVGSERDMPVDVRVVGATHVPLERAVRDGRFRSDLYHRLAVLRIHLPPLRMRREDIPLLVEHFLASFSRKYRRPACRLTGEAVGLLEAYLWPGNVRELRNVLERVFIEGQAEVIGARAFREWVQERQDFSPGDWGPDVMNERTPALAPPYPLSSESLLLTHDEPSLLPGAVNAQLVHKRSTRPAQLTVDEIRSAYREANGNLTAAARSLGVHRATLYRYLEKLGLQRDSLD